MSDGINHTCINRTDCMGMIRSRDQALAAVNLLVAKQDQEIDEILHQSQAIAACGRRLKRKG